MSKNGGQIREKYIFCHTLEISTVRSGNEVLLELGKNDLAILDKTTQSFYTFQPKLT